MSKYVISDVHGYLDRMFDVLRIANFDWDNDELYVLGDMIDRGPQSAEALHWAVEEAPDNVHFLLGNHEDMAYRPLLIVDDEGPIDRYIFENPWSWNGGYNTLDNCRELYGAEWCLKAALWIRDLPLYYIVDDKLLVHAGLVMGGARMDDDYIRDGKDELIEIPGIEKPQWSQHLLWARERWFLDQNSYPYDIIFGHTPTPINWMQNVQFAFAKFKKGESNIHFEGEPGDIVRISGFENGKVRYCIDTGRHRMGLLRLDDYAEFYSEYEREEEWVF